ncbi:MAG: glycosyltransferase family 4 protein [Euryarchaeota archaeon]|nr:glycosyltransferase family 4 protein [Euryarchaeota archaeon]
MKGTFAQFGGAERDLLNNLPAWSQHFDITLATLNLPKEARESLDELGINYLTPVKKWLVPRGAWAEARALASRKSTSAWLSMLDLTEQITGLREVLVNCDAIHITSGVGSLEFTGLAPSHIPLHYYCLEPHRGLYEDVLHRTIEGTPKRSLWITSMLLGKQRRRDQKFVDKLNRRRNTIISGNSSWIQQRISSIYGIESKILLPTVDLATWNPKEEENNEKQWENGCDSNYVVTIGRASHVKGSWETLEMLVGTDLTLALVGGGDGYDLARLSERAEQLKVKLDIQPRLEQDDLVALVKGAVAVVSLAYDEPFGLTPIEAQAAGTPAIMVAEGGFKFTVTDEVSGRLLPRGDWPAWHQALEQARNPAIRKSWTIAGRENIAAMGLTPQDQGAKLAEMFGFSTEEE